MDSDVRGVTSVDDELFVLLNQKDNQVAVYSIDDYQLLHYINLPGLVPRGQNDITSCVRHKCLYMSDWNKSCIHRYDLASSLIGHWLVPGKIRGLSVTPSCNLLVTCYEPNKLIELRGDKGESVREIALQSDITCPWHSVQLTTGQYVVCHGVGYKELQRVCIVDDDGQVTRSCGGKKGSNVGQLDAPRHLAVDKDSQSIFVANYDNGRVVLLSPTLEFVRYVSSYQSRPERLHFHQATRRLFVGHGYRSSVTVIQW